MKLRVYLDTSVFSALLDERTAARQADTARFFARLGEFEAETSSLARDQLMATPDPGRRADLLKQLEGVRVVPVASEAKALAERYVEAGVFPHGALDDAIHAAVAVLGRYNVLVSWNFKHLVNRRKRAALSNANVSWGLPDIEVVAPPEL